MPDEPVRAPCDEAAGLRKDSEASPERQHGRQEPDVARKGDEIAGQDETCAVSGGLPEREQ